MSVSRTFTHQYAGPPFAANGGHLAGVLAETAGLTQAHVEFMAPVPLDTSVEIDAFDGTAAVAHLGNLLANASAVSLLDVATPAVDWDIAESAARHVDPTGRPFPLCYVCGPDREHDGLHLQPGEVSPGLVATVWVPTAAHAHGCGAVPLRVVTAALDCPSAFSFLRRDEAALLAAMTFEVRRLPRVGERLTVTGSLRRVEGRRVWATTVVATAEGERIGRAENLWVRVDEARIAALKATASRVAA